MRIFGACAILLSAIIFVRSYTRQKRRRVAVAGALLSFLIHAREGAARYLTPMSDIVGRIEDELLLSLGFRDEYMKSSSVYAAYTSVAEGYGGEIFTLLDAEFSALGRGYLCEEESRLCTATDKIGACLDREREACEKDIRVAGTLTVAAALGIIILFL